MGRIGRPRGTGCDDLLRIVRIRRRMRDRGATRRAAIIGLYGLDQLRRLEKKMASIDESEIHERLIERLPAAASDGTMNELMEAFEDEGFLVLRTPWRMASEHRASNTLNPFAS
jgi:hypothetical protein